MRKTLNITDEQRAQAARNIENGFAFTEDVLEDPTLLERIPDGAEVIAVPKAERDPERQYDLETRRMVATFTMPASDEQVRHDPSQPRKNSNRPTVTRSTSRARRSHHG